MNAVRLGLPAEHLPGKLSRIRSAIAAAVPVGFAQHASSQIHASSGAAEAINCHHNYVARETHFGTPLFITRKGAISARPGNPQSFCSCSHGAGRRMSRTETRKRFNRGDLEAQTAGVECRKDSAVIDEIPVPTRTSMKSGPSSAIWSRSCTASSRWCA